MLASFKRENAWKAPCRVLDINPGSVRSATYLSVDSSRRRFLKSMRERGTDLKRGSFCFLCSSFSILQPRRQARFTLYSDFMPTPFWMTSGYRVGNFIFPRNQTFPFQPVYMDHENTLQPAFAACSYRCQRRRTSSNGISNPSKRTEKASPNLSPPVMFQ